MSKISELISKHKAEINELQDNCLHLKYAWMKYMWAPGHFGLDIRVCDECGKQLEQAGVGDTKVPL
jgi:hypothetical protein